MNRRLSPSAFGAVLVGTAILPLAAPVCAQDETALKRAFEGKRVVLKIDMPATHKGVDVYPDRDLPVDYSKTADRIKSSGVAISTGEEQMITKVHVVRDHIEFHLGGGGYGTFADALSSPYQPPAIPQTETAEEARIRGEIATTSDSGVRRSLERRLGELQRQRQADNAAAERQVMELNRAAEAEERERRLSSGSRFNIRYDGPVPPQEQTPDGVMKALAEYVDFSPMTGSATTPTVPAGPGAGVLSLKKGMTVEEVEKLLGPATAIQTATTDDLEIMTRTYAHPDHRVVAKFVSGVLVDFAITPH